MVQILVHLFIFWMTGFDFQMVRRFVSTLPLKGSTTSMGNNLFYNQHAPEPFKALFNLYKQARKLQATLVRNYD